MKRIATGRLRGGRCGALAAAALAVLVLIGGPAAAQTDPYSDCVAVESSGAANRAQTDPYSECPPGTAPKLITQSTEPEDEVLGTRILPFTGAAVLGFVALGLGAIAVGAVLARRRRGEDQPRL